MAKPFILSLCALLLSCATTQSGDHPRPLDMSAARHRQQASMEERAAAEHEREAQRISSQTPSCGSAPTSQPDGASVDDICWSARREAAQQQEYDAAQHRRHASEHRAAAAALEEAETTACQGLSEPDRVLSPFYHWRDIKFVNPRPDGATIVFAEVPGLTRDSLQRLVDCHMARNAALGYDVPQAYYSPIALKGVDQAVVSETSQGLAVTITSSDHTIAQAISARSRNLLPEKPSPTRQAGMEQTQ